MESIYFKTDKELISFCNLFFQRHHHIHVQWKKSKQMGNIVQFTELPVELGQLLPVFSQLFCQERLDDMLRHIARSVYYFEADEEIEHVVELTKWLLADEQNEKKWFHSDGSLDACLQNLFRRHLVPGEPVHYDGMLTFSLKPLEKCLTEAVGCGIDEMKREEEHQRFMQHIREYVQQQKTKTALLYIVQGKAMQLFKISGEPYTRMELYQRMREEPLYMIGLDEHEWNLAPILSLLPEKIYVFGDEPEDAKTATLRSVFQERLSFFPLAAFPFASRLK